MPVVNLELRGDIAHVTIDNPPVNALSKEVRAGLLSAVQQIADLPSVRAVVLACAGRSFVAGADIREFGKPPEAPFLPDVLAAIEAAPLPWVAALHGTALGGGLELAMACHARIAAPGTRLGLPEVTLGLIPGAGGTVRLPRLVPMADAVAMVTGGKPIDAAAARAMGLLDRMSGGDLAAEAAALAADLAGQGGWGPTLSRAPASGDAVDWSAEAARLLRRSRGAKAPLEALDALREGADLAPEAALREERARFLRLSASPEAAALRHIFFAERAAGRSLRTEGTAAGLSPAGVVGGGTMGAGIALALLLSGSQVRLIERGKPAAEAARDRVQAMLGETVSRGVVSRARADALLDGLSASDDYAALADCPLVIEAVFEDLAVKRAVFDRLDAVMPEAAVLATNTSYLDVNELAASTRDPSRVLGLHFFAPAHVMKLLEVVRGAATGADALATGAALARRLGKVAVVAGVCDGFIGNRIMAAYRRECEFMLEEGALPDEIDAAMRDFGFAMGIFEVQDLSGLDIAWAQRKARAPHRDPQERYAQIADRLCEAGRLGRKTGRGWYDYASGAPLPDPEVRRVIEAESRRAGRMRRAFAADEIMARILGVMQAEGRAILDEGIAETAADIDVVMVLGYGFPRHRGGPMFMAAPEAA